MVEKKLTAKKISAFSAHTIYRRDENDSIHSTGVVVNDGNYDNGGFLDRDYDLREVQAISINLENIGANDVKYKILSTNKHFDILDTDLTDDDFDKEEKAETTLAKSVKATGSVEVTGGPSVKAEGDLTLVSAVANTFADGIVTCAAVEVGDTVTFNNLVYTAVAGSPSEGEFDQSGTNDQCAESLATQITADTRVGTSGDGTATDSTDTCTITTDVKGTAGNAITLVTSNGTRLAVTGSGTLADGVTEDSVIVNGNKFTAVNGTKSDDTEFDISGTDTAAAADLVLSINDDTRPGVTVPTIDELASNVAGVVTIEAAINDGADGNAIDTIGSANITADAATLASGVTSTMTGITVDGQEIMDGVAVRWTTNDTTTAKLVRDNINGFTSVPNYTATEDGAGVVTIIAALNEPSTATVTSTTSTMTKTDGNMSGGAGGKSDLVEIIRNSPTLTAIRLRAKEAAAGSPGTIRADVRAFKS